MLSVTMTLQNACQTKQLFFSKKGARDAAAKQNVGSKGGRKYRAYNCKFCGHFHIGHSKSKTSG